MANLGDLPKDVYRLLETPKAITPEAVKRFTDSLCKVLTYRFCEDRPAPVLRMSNLGTPCERKLWYDINEKQDGEKLTGQTLLKFTYGDIVEALVLWLASEAGHDVKGQQDEVQIKGVKGHRDAIIDGVLTDVKSASGRGFDKFKFHKLESDDPFGYLAQLGAYLHASKGDERLQVKGQAAFLAVNKESGALAIDVYNFPNNTEQWEELVQNKQDMLKEREPPNRGFSSVPDGKSGNMKLGVNCSYCAHKTKCWPGLRSFAYSNGVRHLTVVAKTPDVFEIGGQTNVEEMLGMQTEPEE